MRIPFCLTLALLAFPIVATAACPKNKKEWRARAPRIFAEKAARQGSPLFHLGTIGPKLKKSITAKTTPYREHNIDFAMVELKDKETSLFLTGILRCDPRLHEPRLLSLVWSKDGKGGLVPVREP